VASSLVAFLRGHPIKRVAISVSPLLERLGIHDALRQGGFDVKRWDEISLDAMYDFDCAVTDVDCAVAENATLVIKPSAKQGRSMSLTPMFHVAIVDPAQIMPDLIDLFDRMGRDPDRTNSILITGPSKTADIEMNVVTGVHGPNVVSVFLLE
jgi:L-lactate dehydrogenase complex protein LldG